MSDRWPALERIARTLLARSLRIVRLRRENRHLRAELGLLEKVRDAIVRAMTMKAWQVSPELEELLREAYPEEPECTCYEILGGHQPGCYFHGRAT